LAEEAVVAVEETTGVLERLAGLLTVVAVLLVEQEDLAVLLLTVVVEQGQQLAQLIPVVLVAALAL
jgi:hypothetical protein